MFKRLLFFLVLIPAAALADVSGPTGTYIQKRATLQTGAIFYVSSGTAVDFNTTRLKFSDGTTLTTAPSGSGGSGGFWIGIATSALNMAGSYAVFGATNVVTSSMSVTGGTVTLNGLSYILPNSIGTGSRLQQVDLTNGKYVISYPPAVTNGMTTSSTDSVSGAKVFNSTVTLPTVAQTGTLDGTGEIALQTNAYTATGSSSTLVFYADGQKYYVITATGIPFNGSIQKFNSRTNRYEIAVDSTSSSGGGAGVGDAVLAGTQTFSGINTFTGGTLYSSGSTHSSISSETFTNANIVLAGTSKVYYPDGSIQVSSPPASILNQTTRQVGGTMSIDSGTVAGILTVDNIRKGPVFTETFAPSFIKLSTTNEGGTFAAVDVENFANSSFGIVDLYEFGSLQSRLAYTDANGSGFGITDALGTFVHKWQNDGAYAINAGQAGWGEKLMVGGNIGFDAASSTQSFTMSVSTGHSFNFIDATAANVVVTLPNLGTTGFGATQNAWYKFCKTDTSTHTVTFAAPGTSDTIDSVTLSSAGACTEYYGHVPNGGSTVGKYRNVSALSSLSSSSGGGGSGTITGVTAGTGLTGGGTSGSVTLNADTSVLLTASSATATYDQKTDVLSGNRTSGGTFGAVNGSALTNLTAANIASGSLGTSVLASSVAAASFQTALSAGSNITLTNTNGGVQIAASGSGSSAVTSTGGVTATLDFATHTAINIGSIGWADSGAGWTLNPSTHSSLNTSFTLGASSSNVQSLQFMTVAHATYSFTGTLIWATNGSAAGGVRFGLTMPADVSSTFYVFGGAGASATTANFSQKGSAASDITTTPAGAAASQTWSEFFSGEIVTGATGGPVNVFMAAASLAGTFTVRPGCQITAWKD